MDATNKAGDMNSSRKSMKYGMFRQATNKMSGEQSGQEDNSTQISNHLDPSHRNALESHQDGTLKDKRKLDNIRMPKWIAHFDAQYVYFPLKLRSFTFGKLLDLHAIYGILNIEFICRNFDEVTDPDAKQRILTFVIVRNAIKL